VGARAEVAGCVGAGGGGGGGGAAPRGLRWPAACVCVRGRETLQDNDFECLSVLHGHDQVCVCMFVCVFVVREAGPL
jgi:hypothetical protein